MGGIPFMVSDNSIAIAGAGIHARYRGLSRRYDLQKQELEACRRNYQELYDELQALKAGIAPEKPELGK